MMLKDKKKCFLKWPRKILKNYILLKSMKNIKLSVFFSNFQDLNYSSYKLFEATFQ